MENIALQNELLIELIMRRLDRLEDKLDDLIAMVKAQRPEAK